MVKTFRFTGNMIILKVRHLRGKIPVMILISCLCLLFLIPFQVREQEAIRPGETLDLERCIAI